MSRAGGMGARPGSRSGGTGWLTPRWVLDALGRFDLDPCAAPGGAWVTAARHYAWPEADGLALPWAGRVWLNPPYGRGMGAWMARMAEHARGTALVFARTETALFQSHVFGRADALLFLRGRLTFADPSGADGPGNAGAPSVLAAYGPEDVERLMDSRIPGHLVGLRRPVLVALAFAVDPPGGAAVWAEVVRDAMASLGGRASLRALYAALEGHPRSRANRHWQAKVRQTVGGAGFRRVGTGQYELAFGA